MPAPEHLARLAGVLQVPVAALEPAYWEFRDGYDVGCSDRDYWGRVAAALGVDVTHEQVALVTTMDARGWLRPDLAGIALVEDLRRGGVGVALLSNAPPPIALLARALPWARLFHRLFFSCEEKVSKPDPEIYSRVAEGLRVEPSRLVFFDDRQVNVDGALACGWDAHRWHGPDHARRVLTTRTLLPAQPV